MVIYQLKYRQCSLHNIYTNSLQVSYIPDKFAILNKIIKLKENEQWVDGWKVVYVSSRAVDEVNLPNVHKDVKGHRKMTGDSMRKTNAKS